MAAENVNMEINTASATTVTAEDSSNEIRLTPEMLSKVNVSVNMKFLADIRNVLEVATQRSAWKANELSTVGSLVDTLDNAFKQLATKTDEVVTAVNDSSADAETSTNAEN